MKTLVLLFPHRSCFKHEEDEIRWIAPHYDFTPSRLEHLLLVPRRLVKRLRSEGWETVAFTHTDHSGRQSPIANSWLHPDEIDRTVSTGVRAAKSGRWLGSKRPDWKQLIEQEVFSTDLLVAGFHYSDCVQKFVRAAFECGCRVQISPVLTDLYYTHKVRLDVTRWRGLRLTLPLVADPFKFDESKEKYQADLRRRLHLLE